MDIQEKIVKIKCQGASTLDISAMKEFQGELKSLSKEAYVMLRNEILDTGFAFPIHIWKNNEELYIVGGHQRKRTLEEMRAEGIKIPPIPIVYIEADSYEQAKRRVIQDIAQYGKVERQGLYQFMNEANLSPGDLAESFKIPELDLPSFNSEFFFDSVSPIDDLPKKEAIGSTEYSESNFSSFEHKCPRCGFEFD